MKTDAHLTASETALSKPVELPDLPLDLAEQHPKDIADHIADFDLEVIRAILRRLPDETTAEIIAELPQDTQIRLFEGMRLQRLSGIIAEMFSDDAADVLGQVSADRLREIMATLSKEDATILSRLLQYPEDSAGGIMQGEFVSVRDDITLAEAREAIRVKEDRTDTESPLYIYVTDRIGRLRGILRVRDLLFRNPASVTRDVMIKEVRCVSVHADQEVIAQLFRDYHYVAIPVVDDMSRLVGIVTSDDAIDVIEEEATEDMQRMVGVSGEESVTTPLFVSIRHRLPWLALNLGTAFFAGWVVSVFEATIAQYAFLAIFLPIIAGQGGNTGTQTLTIVVRALALGEVRPDGRLKVLGKEILVGLLNGLCIGAAVGLISWLWKGNSVLGAVVAVAMVLNMLAAAIAGVVVPLGLKTMRIDPALASAIMVTAVTDVVGFFVFLSLASLGFALLPGAFP
jgi:magnesium transporter